MALETLSSNELLNFIIYDTISATPFSYNDSSETTTTTTTTSFLHLQENPPPQKPPACGGVAMEISPSSLVEKHQNNLGVQLQVGKKKRKRRPRVCKNKEEAENQRMTHIAVERNRRKQMNEHLAVLRSLMPESYVQRGDQASIVGGAIEFVKELEHLLQSLEAQKFLTTQQQQQQQQQQQIGISPCDHNLENTNKNLLSSWAHHHPSPPFSQFFSYPQYTCSQIPNKYTSKSKAAIADIEVTLIETHANLRILSRKRLTQLSKMVACFQTLYLSILHLNVTTLDPLVLYSISAKVEEGCMLNSADEIAGAVNQMLRIIEEEATLC